MIFLLKSMIIFIKKAIVKKQNFSLKLKSKNKKQTI